MAFAAGNDSRGKDCSREGRGGGRLVSEPGKTFCPGGEETATKAPVQRSYGKVGPGYPLCAAFADSDTEPLNHERERVSCCISPALLTELGGANL